MAEKIGFLDRITNRTAALGALFVGITALMNSASDLFGKLREKWVILQQLPWWSQWAVSAFLVIIAFYLIRAAFAGKSRLLRPERFLIQPDEPRFLKGREREVQGLGQLCDREPLVFLDGESGCGKSALVCAGLLPWCEGDPARPLPLRIDLSGAPWDSGIADLLGRTLWIEKGDLCREFEFKQYPQADAVFQVLTQIGARTARMPLLIFDQFDDYQTAYRDQFYPAGGSRLLTSQEFLASNHFWSQVAQGVIAQHWHCLVVTRNDTRAGLDAIRFCDARSYTLSRVEQNLIAPLFDEITTPGPDGAPVVDQPELGWNPLRERLLSDLARQEGQILPIQLAVSLDAMRRWRFLTDAQYRTQGGLPGLERLHVQGYVQETARVTGLSVATLIAMLLRLTDPVRKKARRASFSELVQLLTGVFSDVLRQALTTLEERRIVRRVAHAEEAGGEAWLLYHDYLARGVMEAHRASDRWRLLLDEQAIAWQRADGWREKWRFLLPLRTQARLAWEILHRRLRIGAHRRYMAWSLLRLTPIIILPAGVWTYDWWQLQQDMQIAERTIAALDDNEELSNYEAELFQLLIGRSWRAKQVMLDYALANSDSSKRASTHISMLTHVIVGLDRTGERGKAIEQKSLSTLTASKSEQNSRSLAIRLLAQNHITETKFIFSIILGQINQLLIVVDVYGASTKLMDLSELFTKLDSTAIKALHQHLLEQVNAEKDSVKRSILAIVLFYLIDKAKMDPKIHQVKIQDVLKWINTEENPVLLSELASKLDPQETQIIARDLMKRMKAEIDYSKREQLAAALNRFGLAPKLDIETTRLIVQDLMNNRYYFKLNRYEDQLFLRLLLNLDEQTIQEIAQNFLEAMKVETDLTRKYKITHLLMALFLNGKLKPHISQFFARYLLEWMTIESEPSIIVYIIEQLLYLATELEPQLAYSIAQDLLNGMKNKNDSIELTDIKTLRELINTLDPQAAQAIANNLTWQSANMRQEPERKIAYLARVPQALTSQLKLINNQVILEKKLHEQIKSESNPLAFSDLVRVLLVFSPKLESQSAQTITHDLLNRIKTENDLDILNELILALNILISRLEPQIIQTAINVLLDKMNTLRSSDVLINLAAALQDLEQQSIMVSHSDAIIRLQPYVNLLKGYAGGIIQCRIILLHILELITSQKFDGDKWRFVEWATSKDAAKFHLDLD